MGRLRFRCLRWCCNCRCFSPTLVAAMSSPEVMPLGRASRDSERPRRSRWSVSSHVSSGASCSSHVPPSTRSCQNTVSPTSPANNPSAPTLSPAAPAATPASVSPSVPGVSPSPYSPRASLSPYSLPRQPSSQTFAGTPAGSRQSSAVLGVPVLVSRSSSRPVSPATSLDGRGQVHFSSGRQGRPRYATAPTQQRHARALQPSDLRVRVPRLSPRSLTGASPRAPPPSLSPSLSFERHRRQQTTFERLRQELKTTYFPRVAASDSDDWETFKAQMIEESERERRQNLQKEEFETLSPRERVMIPTLYVHPQDAALGNEGDNAGTQFTGVRAERHFFSLPPVLISPAAEPESADAAEPHAGSGQTREEAYHEAERPAGARATAETERGVSGAETPGKAAARYRTDRENRALSPSSSVSSPQPTGEETQGERGAAGALVPGDAGAHGALEKRRERNYSVAPAAREKGTPVAIIQQKKNALHKRIWSALRKKKFRDFEHAMAEME
ncbi:hypothetical protein NCLIV_059040 [Neospora caninum Liverpool]|nr:hypothetical protein NCLIV_059040 [Neospora caninum Liverpool]CBZ55480.1 hypothetical protein NCLIV_059040 [Neospora caninum Liverpool]|eukprot:XP_003885508.1 hypothetical protein NCLIV_059040 [Neospora caninum Liverpool]